MKTTEVVDLKFYGNIGPHLSLPFGLMLWSAIYSFIGIA